MAEHDCNICNGVRPNNGAVCLGCGSPIARCKRPKPRKTIPRCPRGCISAVYETEPGRYCCRGCSAVFEQLESVALDDRPDVNAEKRERASVKLWKGGRR